MLSTNKKYCFTIGRFQPLHAGHIKLIKKVLDEGESVCVALRDTPISNTDPYSVAQRMNMFNKEFSVELANGRMIVIVIPDIKEVFYGRKVGWGVREIKLDAETESISATQIRAEKNNPLPGI